MSKIKYVACAGVIAAYLGGFPIPFFMYITENKNEMREEEQIRVLGYRPRILENLMKFKMKI